MAIGPRAARVRQVCELTHRTNIAGAWDNDSANKDIGLVNEQVHRRMLQVNIFVQKQ